MDRRTFFKVIGAMGGVSMAGIVGQVSPQDAPQTTLQPFNPIAPVWNGKVLMADDMNRIIEGVNRANGLLDAVDKNA